VSIAADALLVVTKGDPAGIGPEITLRAWLSGGDKRNLPPFAASAIPGRSTPSLRRPAGGFPIGQSASQPR
jgi:4-hydroxythreonine-4-phosphate dehydrogenase